MRPLLLAALALLAAGPIQAQTVGNPIPPPPPGLPELPPETAGRVLTPQRMGGADAAARADAVVGRFRAAYDAMRRPRLAIWWNRDLAETGSDWQSDSRLVSTTEQSGTGRNGPVSQRSTTTLEFQNRVPSGDGRVQPSETWEWEFKDGFLSPFLNSGAIVLDRGAILNLTALDQPGAGTRLLEASALKNHADILVQVLVAPSERSTTGYELNATLTEVKTGRIIGMVNSRDMRGWQREALRWEAGPEGFVEIEEDQVGPEGNERWRAGPNGFVRAARPPRLKTISQGMALNVMDALATAWGR